MKRLVPLAAASLALLGPPALAQTMTAIEFYNRTLDHYFVSPLEADIAALDSGRLPGWVRTGQSFRVLGTETAGGERPVCRFYIPPAHGDSHFFSASPVECADVQAKVAVDPNYSGYVLESSSVFFVGLPDPISGACAAGLVPVYRLWNQRADSNHRYTTDVSIKRQMIARHYVAEGYGPDAVAMCVPAGPDEFHVRVSDVSPFAPGCEGENAFGGVFYLNSEVEPMVARDPRDPLHVVAAWQQDRWSNGGARGILSAVTFDGGRTWTRSAAPLSRCTGGNAANGADYARATDPWVTFAPDGTAHQISISFTGPNFGPNASNAILASRSFDGARTWGAPTAVIRDEGTAFNDKEAITADPGDARYVYAAWDRLVPSGSGPSTVARTVDGGVTWEPARAVHEPGAGSQTINNQIVALPDGTLILFFTELTGSATGRLSAAFKILRSLDKGVTWSAPIPVAVSQSIGVTDPENGTQVRDARTTPSIAAGANGHLAVAWQDARFTGGVVEQVAFTRSVDGGLTWSPAARVNGAPSVQAFVPTVHIADDGTYGVGYYDFRTNSADPLTLPTDRWLARSTDGTHWTESHVGGPFDLADAPFANGLFLGDYQALTSIGERFVSVHAETNPDRNNRADIVAASSAPPAARATPTMRAQVAEPLTVDVELARKLDTSVRRSLEWQRSR